MPCITTYERKNLVTLSAYSRTFEPYEVVNVPDSAMSEAMALGFMVTDKSPGIYTPTKVPSETGVEVSPEPAPEEELVLDNDEDDLGEIDDMSFGGGVMIDDDDDDNSG